MHLVCRCPKALLTYFINYITQMDYTIHPDTSDNIRQRCKYILQDATESSSIEVGGLKLKLKGKKMQLWKPCLELMH